MARPGGLELPTFWFVVESREILSALFGVAYPEDHSIFGPSVGLLGLPEAGPNEQFSQDPNARG